jgi:hypothetical protein
MKKSILLLGLIVTVGVLALSGCASSCDSSGYGGTVEGGNNVSSSGAGGGSAGTSGL